MQSCGSVSTRWLRPGWRGRERYIGRQLPTATVTYLDFISRQRFAAIYEGFGPTKSQFIIKCLTDNKNRSAAEIRHIFTKYGGSLGAVMWNFEQKGVIRISTENIKRLNWEELELELIDAGADDIVKQEEGVTIYTKIEDLQKLKKFLEKNNIKTESAEIEYITKEEQTIKEESKEKIEKFIEKLEDNGDISD